MRDETQKKNKNIVRWAWLPENFFSFQNLKCNVKIEEKQTDAEPCLVCGLWWVNRHVSTATAVK